MGPKQFIPLQVRVDPRVMAMKGYSIFSRASELEFHHQDSPFWWRWSLAERVKLNTIYLSIYVALPRATNAKSWFNGSRNILPIRREWRRPVDFFKQNDYFKIIKNILKIFSNILKISNFYSNFYIRIT